MDDSETTFILGRSICKDYLGFREDTQFREVQPHHFDGISGKIGIFDGYDSFWQGINLYLKKL